MGCEELTLFKLWSKSYSESAQRHGIVKLKFEKQSQNFRHQKKKSEFATWEFIRLWNQILGFADLKMLSCYYTEERGVMVLLRFTGYKSHYIKSQWICSNVSPIWTCLLSIYYWITQP